MDALRVRSAPSPLLHRAARVGDAACAEGAGGLALVLLAGDGGDGVGVARRHAGGLRGAPGIGAEGEVVWAANDPVRAVGVDGPIGPVGQRLEEALPGWLEGVFEDEATGALAADDGQALLMRRIEIGLDEGVLALDRDGLAADETAIGGLLDDELGLFDLLSPGVATHGGGPFDIIVVVGAAFTLGGDAVCSRVCSKIYHRTRVSAMG